MFKKIREWYIINGFTPLTLALMVWVVLMMVPLAVGATVAMVMMYIEAVKWVFS